MSLNRAKFRVAWLLVHALTLAAGLAQGVSSTGDAGRVNQILQELRQAKVSERPERFELSEQDLNAFARVVVEGRSHLGVRSVLLDLRRGGVIAGEAVVDMDQVRVGGFASEMFKKVLSGTQTVKTAGRLEVTGGRARYSIEEASFNGIWVPAWLVNSVVARLGAGQPPHIDITEPFQLPFGIADVRVEADRLVIVR